MLSDPLIHNILKTGSLKEFCERACRRNGMPYDEDLFSQLMSEIMEVRLDHDFEYWAVTTAFITDKDSGVLTPFVLNYPQRLTLKILEKERVANKRIRIVNVKARQMGLSTLYQIYFGWIQNRIKIGWGSVIVAAVENQARNIRSMYTKLSENYPKEVGKIELKPFEGSSKTRFIQDRACVLDITSAESPESTRSFDYALCHLSEVAFWPSTIMKKPKDMVQNLRAGVKKVPLSMVILESTAKGVGNFFHNEWRDAVSGKSAYIPLFMPWFNFDKNTETVTDHRAFIRNMNEDDWVRWEQGATLEGIAWYNKTMKDENYDKWRMESEYPGTADEAFQSTGDMVFHRAHINRCAVSCREPLAKGKLHAQETKGAKAFVNIEFETTNEGNLWIWDYPDKSANVSNRYAVSVDIGGTTDGADFSIIRVLDRFWLLDGGVPEAIATWRGHVDQDQLAWIAAQIAYWYNKALLIVESNSLKKEELSAEGDHFLTVLDEIAGVYDNLYTRSDPEKVREGAPVLYGFHTNTKTKQMIINHYRAVLRDDGYMERDIRVVDEQKSYQRFEDGSMGATDGTHDDLLMATAIVLWVSDSKMDLPVEYRIKTRAERLAKQNKHINESTF